MISHVSAEKYIMRCLMICTAHQNFSVNKIEKNKFGRTRSAWVDWSVLYRVLVGKTKGMVPLGRPKRRWENVNKIDFYVGSGL